MAIPYGAQHSRIPWTRYFRTNRSRATVRADLPARQVEDKPTTQTAKRAARWAGASTWFVPSTEAQDVTGLPSGLDVGELTVAELRAAVELRFVAPTALSDKAWEGVMAVPEEEIPGGARSLLKKIRRRSDAHQLATPTEPIELPTLEGRGQTHPSVG